MVIRQLSNYFFDSLLLLSLIALVTSYLLWKRGLVWVGAIGLVITIGWLALSITVANTSLSPSCVWCHEMKPEYDSWRVSVHNRVQCLACHVAPGGSPGLLLHEVEALSEVAAHFTGNYPRILNKDSSLSQKRMTSATCDRCHDMYAKRQVELTAEIKMDHPAHLALKISCQTCHNRVTHRGARGYPYLDGMGMMSGCMRCHLPGKELTIARQKAPSNCTTCHKEPDWTKKIFGKSAAGADDLDTCVACHRQRDPRLVADFSKSKMFKSAVGCPDCHNSHLKKFVAEPAAKDCAVCHANAAKKVISGRMAFKGYKPPFKTAREVNCLLCHRPHAFKAVRPR